MVNGGAGDPENREGITDFQTRTKTGLMLSFLKAQTSLSEDHLRQSLDYFPLLWTVSRATDPYPDMTSSEGAIVRESEPAGIREDELGFLWVFWEAFLLVWCLVEFDR